MLLQQMMCSQLKASGHVKKMISIKDYEHLAANQGDDGGDKEQQTEDSHMTYPRYQHG